MAYPSIVRTEGGLPVFVRGTVLTGILERARGLIGMRDIRPDEAWVFPCCRSVHTWFMSIPIDVVCLDAAGKVLSVRTVPPWRLPGSVPGTAVVIEAASGRARGNGVVEGARLVWSAQRERS